MSPLERALESVSLCRLQMTEAALALSEQKVHNLGELLSATKQEQASMAERHFAELQQQKQVGWVSPSQVWALGHTCFAWVWGMLVGLGRHDSCQ